jgi:small-conductance mechanosensitive channel
MALELEAATSPLAVTGSGYFYELLKALGLSEATARHLQDLLLRPLSLLIVMLVAWLVSRYGSRAIRQTVRRLRSRAELRAAASVASDSGVPDNAAIHLALAQRVETVGRILATCFRVVIWVIAILTMLGIIGINLTPLVAGATVIGATVGFGAQTLVRDFLSGFLLLAEDQYRIGDSLQTQTATGVVEEMTLRVTRLRADDGSVWYVPNGDIRTLANLSRHSSVNILDVFVPLGTPIGKAAAAIEEEARAAVAEPDIAGSVLDTPVMMGVEQADASGIVLRLSVRARPGSGEAVTRAIRTRVATRLAAEGILQGTAEPESSAGGVT